ncbi:jg17852 [Pararge aegeria aegeria]|uniref:Jg17852 protein n=1 Tax=Pararge aegeria aegeria TaxID=348720 RepID=A0A8S4QQM7_9NEOP|nr:jg17852 [Pararge aegeria aegeria]
MGRLPPAAPSNSPDPLSWVPTYAAFTGAGSPFRHLKTPNVHRFSELSALPIATSAARLAELWLTLQ